MHARTQSQGTVATSCYARHCGQGATARIFSHTNCYTCQRNFATHHTHTHTCLIRRKHLQVFVVHGYNLYGPYRGLCNKCFVCTSNLIQTQQGETSVVQSTVLTGHDSPCTTHTIHPLAHDTHTHTHTPTGTHATDNVVHYILYYIQAQAVTGVPASAEYTETMTTVCVDF